MTNANIDIQTNNTVDTVLNMQNDINHNASELKQLSTHISHDNFVQDNKNTNNISDLESIAIAKCNRLAHLAKAMFFGEMGRVLKNNHRIEFQKYNYANMTSIHDEFDLTKTQVISELKKRFPEYEFFFYITASSIVDYTCEKKISTKTDAVIESMTSPSYYTIDSTIVFNFHVFDSNFYEGRCSEISTPIKLFLTNLSMSIVGDTAKAIGSSITYGQRYAFRAAMGLSSEDDIEKITEELAKNKAQNSANVQNQNYSANKSQQYTNGTKNRTFEKVV